LFQKVVLKKKIEKLKVDFFLDKKKKKKKKKKIKRVRTYLYRGSVWRKKKWKGFPQIS